jgi:hypothetical protein
MSFLDNLENNLKALESQEQGGVDDRKRREAEKTRAIESAPWADRLKNSPYLAKLMRDVTRAGFSRRMKVNIVWIGRTLRLEAIEQRLELEPTARGIEAVMGDRRIPVNLEGEPDELIVTWMEILDRKREEMATAGPAEFIDEGE